MNRKLIAALPLVLLLGACSTYTTPRYAINADTNVALKSLAATNIAVGTFSGPRDFSTSCRAAGPLAPPDGMTHTAYVQKAFENELKVANAHAVGSPRIILTGTVSKLDFSSSRGMTGGSWDINLILRSSNGKSMNATEHYEFESGFGAETACKQTAEAFLPAVQNLIAKVVLSAEFKGLLQ